MHLGQMALPLRRLAFLQTPDQDVQRSDDRERAKRRKHPLADCHQLLRTTRMVHPLTNSITHTYIETDLQGSKKYPKGPTETVCPIQDHFRMRNRLA